MFSFDFNYFSNVLGESESSNNYKAENGIAFGKYQFIPATFNRILEDLGVGAVSTQHFLNNPALQETTYRAFVSEILNYISEYSTIAKSIGKPIVGFSNRIATKINIYGLVAGAWLSGEKGLYNFIVLNEDKEDFNGTYISDYIAKFSNEYNKKKTSLC